MIVGVEHAQKQPLADVVVDEHRPFVAGARLVQHRSEKRVDRAAHAGGKARILSQQGSKQRRARARQAGDEVQAVLHGREKLSREKSGARCVGCWYNRIGFLFVTRVMPLAAITIAPGVSHFPDFLDRAAQGALRDEVLAILELAPPFRPRMPRTGQPFSVCMSNCGALGWVSDESGYRYQPTHPETGRPWPAIPSRLVAAFAEIAPGAPQPEAC